MTRYIVFERPAGSKCWTVSWYWSNSVEAMLPAGFSTLRKAQKHAAYVERKRRGWKDGKPDQVPMQAYIAAVELPE